jgi:hypothetical protein
VAINETTLRQWLQWSGGSLPAEFLRQQGLDPSSLVSCGLLSVAPNRWSASYVAGPLLVRPFKTP